MRTQKVCCDRCAAVVVEHGSIIELKAGELTKQHAEPWIDLCGSCSERFVEWLRSGKAHQAGHATPGHAASVMVDGLALPV